MKILYYSDGTDFFLREHQIQIGQSLFVFHLSRRVGPVGRMVFLVPILILSPNMLVESWRWFRYDDMMLFLFAIFYKNKKRKNTMIYTNKNINLSKVVYERVY